MAKVTGPLMSMDARGKFGGTLVYSGWKGRATVRTLVTPANPMSQAQQDARNIVRVCGAGQSWANNTAQIRSGETVTDKELLIAAAPSGQAWNGFLVFGETGAGALNYSDAETAYAALTALEKTAWNTAAGALVPPIPQVNQVDAGGVPGTPMPAGQVFYHYEYGLFKCGVASAPTGTPPTYA